MHRRKGIDVSYADGRIDWRRVRKDRIEFAMVRAGFGDGNIDQEFERNARECNRERIPLGIYWFSYAYTREMARREAKQCVEIIRRYRVEYPVAFDFEEDSIDYAREHGVTITKDLATDFTREFCDEIRRAGYKPMFYTNLSDLEDYFDIRRLREYELWLAKYQHVLGVDDVDMWQYSDSGRVRGIRGEVDMNYSFKDYEKRNPTDRHRLCPETRREEE